MKFVTTFTGLVTDITHEDDYMDNPLIAMQRVRNLPIDTKIELKEKIESNAFGFESILSHDFNLELTNILGGQINYISSSCYWDLGFFMVDLLWSIDHNKYVQRYQLIEYIIQTLGDGWSGGSYTIGEKVRFIIDDEYKQIFVPESVSSEETIYEGKEIKTDKRYFFDMYLASVNHTFKERKYITKCYNKINLHREQPPREAGYYVAGYRTLGGDGNIWVVVGNNFTAQNYCWNNHYWSLVT